MVDSSEMNDAVLIEHGFCSNTGNNTITTGENYSIYVEF